MHTCRSPEVKSEEENKENSVKRLFRNNRNEDRAVDILIRGLWARGTDCIIDVRIADRCVNPKSNRSKDPAKVLAAHEHGKNKKHLLGLALSNVGTFLRLWHRRMVCLAKKPRPC
jgi:hypothetical protein